MAQQTHTTTDAIVQGFQAAVNMSAKELEQWLQTAESLSVGMKDHEGGESTGHQSGRQIVEILRKQTSDYQEADYNQMQRVISYIHRHLAQKPAGDVEHTRWCYSLKNWGCDPLKLDHPR
jgi:hypothetical protein